ncbi:SPOR domain-containing protein [Variovorax terrae]|uniref:SPOR domain-containing protein n=1 Tax=Variovorax terrae TaxID=2923278 RepID=A0A9X2APP0_9BURK|nr:SPOR domain-containing protein [Variovorax terrae]MCJ0762246.1 SPOR domain-containing protein [Variovorax terrae]
MAFFKFRKGGNDQAAAPSQPESIEAMRRRAKHRLIGAAVLVLLGVVGFPMLFDTQPRPIPVDIPIEIPDKGKVKPLAIPVAPPPVAAVAPPPARTASAGTPASSIPATASLSAKEEVVTAKAEPKTEPKVAEVPVAPTSPAIKKEAKPEPRPEPKPAPKADDGAKAKALLEGRDVEKAAGADKAEGRFVVQVGAFADVAKARETRLKVEKSGLKTYTQVADTKDGKRIRVRVGPFASKAEADKAASKIKGLDLPAAILTL